MGTSASTEQKEMSPEQREVEALAASTGALPMLQKAFANLADPQENSIPVQSLQVILSIEFSPKSPHYLLQFSIDCSSTT